MKKRIFSLLLALCLVAGMLPTVAYANTIGGITLQDAVPGTVYLVDFTSSSTTTPIPPTYNSDNRINNLLLEGTDGTIMIQGEGKAYYHDGTHGLAVFNDNCFNIAVAGDAEITFCLCAYSNGGYLRATVDEGKGVFNEESINLNGLTDGAEDTFYYTGEATTIKVTISGCTGESYLHSIKVTNKDNVTVTFNSDGGSTVDEQKVLRGQKATAPTDPTRAGYSFDGWYQGDTEFDFANTPVTENITLTAKWSVDRVKLTKAILDSTYKNSSKYILTSGNYYLGEDISVDTTIGIGTTSSAADVTLDLNGFELKQNSSVVLLYSDCSSTLTLTDSSSDKTGKVINSSNHVVKFGPNSKLNANGGTVEGSVHLYANPEIGPAVIDNTDPSNITVFTGEVSNFGITKGGTFHGTITNISGGSISNGTFNGTVNNDSGASIIHGGTFNGPVNNGGTIKGGIFYGTVSNDESYGRIEDSAKVTVTFNSDGGSSVAEQRVLRGQKVTAPTEPTKAGYSFNGWYNGNTAFDFANTPVIENITLTAKWVERSSIPFSTAPQTYTYDGSAQAFTIAGTSVTGFDIAYKQNGQTIASPTNAGYYDVIITRAEDNTYKAVNEIITNGLVINPATPTENPAKKTTARVIKGKTLADATVTNGEILALDGTTPLTGTFAWVDSTKVMSTDGTEQMVFTPDNTNYAPITIDVAVSAYSTGSGSSTPTYAPTVNQPENGSVTVSPKSPKKGDTVTITPKPDAGYTVEQILVTDKDGNPVEVTNNGDGTYSFTQPAGKVDVEITFMEDNTMLNFFVDVPADAYYYDAVLWAAENGITGGVDDTHFAPNAPCTRAQIVTFLWRAARCPEPETVSSFADVPADSYYTKAVAWAVENGITTGTGDGKFSPDATCTRAQAMTFIYRSEQAQGGGMQGAWMFLNPFEDVNLESYYGEAVMWAVANGVTNGTSDTTFSPGADCTRAQIVTFLYRFFVK